MKVLVVGGGGREHSLIWKIRQSPRVKKIYCAPGNAGISKYAEAVPLAVEDIDGLAHFALEQQIELTVVGPELPLSLGIVDLFESKGLRIFGPRKAGAQLEASKAFTKDLMRREQVPTAKFEVFDDLEQARRYVQEIGPPIVVKADGLAAGKGVILCNTLDDALGALTAIMDKRQFGDAGNKVVIEEFLDGEEASFLAFTDGTCILPLASSQDHKRIFDGDAGPNTGGMGAYSPAPVVTPEIAQSVVQNVLRPVVSGLKKLGIRYKGVLYAGLMIRNGVVKVLEFNVRFGDPECQPLMLRLDSDLVDVIDAVIDERLGEKTLNWKDASAVCIVASSAGYPGQYSKGSPIQGLAGFDESHNVAIFHGGTALRSGDIITDGGRVLGVAALGVRLSEAIDNAYKSINRISWSGMHYRTDIGRRALEKSGFRPSDI